MANQNKFLKLGLFNAGSLNTGHHDFLFAMDRFKADIVAINETWLAEGQQGRAPAVPGYRLRNSPRPQSVRHGRGGGVGFYIKHNIRVRYLKHPENNIEQLWLSSKLNGYHIAIGTAYRPPWMNIDLFIDALTESVSIFSYHELIVLLGDFNINMLDINNKNVSKMCQFLECMELKQVVTEPTHFSFQSETLIDLVCTNAKVKEVTVTNITGSLGHAMVNVKFHIKKNKIPPKLIRYRPLKNIVLEDFNRDLYATDWQSISELPSIDLAVDRFNMLLLSLFDKHAPVKTIRIREDQMLPWLTPTCKYMIELRNKAFETYRESKLEAHKRYYKDLKRLVETSILNEKRAYFNEYVNSTIGNSKLFWQNIKKKILIDPSKSDTLPDCFSDPHIINNHFLNIPHSKNIPKTTLSFFNTHNFNNNSIFELSTVSENSIAAYITSLTSNATGSDGINRDMILLTLPCTLNIITHLVNKSITDGVVPLCWKSALVNPLPKVDRPTNLNELRPISILPYLSKLLERAVYNQLMKYVEENKMLPELQSGFRRGRGTVTALLDVIDNILTERDLGNGSILALLDFSRAFDCLDTQLLLAKLNYYGLNEHALSWFDNYLSHRQQIVRLTIDNGNTLLSDPLPVTRGVPQGSILGPLLFIIYSSDLTHEIKHCKFHCYADDVQLYISVPPCNTTVALHKLNKDLDNIAAWSDRNALVLNPSKSKFMVLGTKNQIKKIINNSDLTLTINSQKIEMVTEAKNLGLLIDSNLRFEKHVQNLITNCFYRLKILYKIREVLSERARITLCESLILSRLNYSDIVFGPCLLAKTQRLIQRIQNACCRFCFNVPQRTHITPFLNEASMLRMEARRQLHLATLMFDLMKFKNPQYLYNKLSFPLFNEGYGTPRTIRPVLSLQRHRSAAFRGSFRYQATKCWNNIPPPIRNIKSKYTFKISYKKYLFKGQVQM